MSHAIEAKQWWAVGPQTLDRLFPFRLVLARDMSICGFGSTLKRIIPTLALGTALKSAFSVVRPAFGEMTFAGCAEFNGVVVLRAASGLQLQGQFEQLDDETLLFACSPIVSGMSSLAEMGLELGAFPPHDSAGDYLVLLQMAKVNLEDLERVSADLRRQQTELLAAHEVTRATLLGSRLSAEALRVSERRYQQLVDAMKEVVFETDDKGRWMFLNPAWTETFGYSVEDALGKAFLDFVHPEDRELCRQAFTALIQRQKGSLTHEFRYVTASGDARRVDVFWRPLLGKHGNVTGIAGTLSDVTEQRTATERLEEARHQMAEATALAQSANQAKSDFLASMSHEIRTPLHALLGMVDLVSESVLSDEQQQLMRSVRVNANMLRHLVGDLLDLAKIEQGRMQLEMGLIEPARIVEEARSFAVQLATGKAVDVMCRVDRGVPAVIVGDELHVRQVLLNLVTNAVKFTERGKVTIGVSFEAAGRHRGVIRFDVSDDGMGIPAVDHPRIFNRFERAKNSQRVSGTGLGLHISRALVELMGGQVGFSSQEGVGSLFYFSVPSDVAKAARTKRPVGRSTKTATSQRAPRQARVLVVEDYESSQKFAYRVLRGDGHEVDIAPAGASALAFSDRCRYDLILMDLQLPDISGFEVAQRIRSAEKVQGDEPVPIVAVTAHAIQGAAQACADAGMNAYATKPLSAKALRHIVNQWADTRRTILVADDSVDAQTVARRYLAALDVRTVGACDGTHVLAQLDRQPVAALVMDLTMPGLDGLATMREVRSRSKFASIPVIMVSGVEDGEQRQAVEALGCAAYLTKPVDRSVLLQAVSDAIERVGSRRATMPPATRGADDMADAIPEYLAGRWADLFDARASVSAGTFDRIESIGHNMKGTGSSYGFAAITRIGRTLERAACARDVARTLDALAEFESVLLATTPPSRDI